MRRNFVTRTIRNGRVTINGVQFAPAFGTHETRIAYDGRLDGQRWVFGLYYGPKNYETYDENGWQRRYVCMWGSEKACLNSAEMDWPGENCINNGFQWEWWDNVDMSAL